MLYIINIVLQSGDIENNPGPAVNTFKSLTVCHWNLNSIWVENFLKLRLLEGYLAVHKFHIICLSETFLDSSISDYDPGLDLDGYNLLGCDHPSNSNRGGVCIYYKYHLPLYRKPSLTQLD